MLDNKAPKLPILISCIAHLLLSLSPLLLLPLLLLSSLSSLLLFLCTSRCLLLLLVSNLLKTCSYVSCLALCRPAVGLVGGANVLHVIETTGRFVLSVLLYAIFTTKTLCSVCLRLML